VKSFFDTSVLIATFLEDHEHHEPSLKAFLRAERKRGFCAAHSLAEVFAVLTRLPGRHRLSGEQALLFLGDVVERLTVVSLTSEEYFRAIRDAAARGVVGGMVHDALLLRCAEKAGAEVVYTWNVRHFGPLGAENAPRVATP
jgi:predicted nucleic acid-binding protein